MTSKLRSKAALLTATTALAATAATGPALAQWASASRASPRHHTPNQCIRLNAGDYNACNLGNSGRGDRPYQVLARYSPDECIRLNGGDYNACNVGHSGRGDLPYKPLADLPSASTTGR